MKLTHPNSEQVLATSPDLATPYLVNGWIEVNEADDQPADTPAARASDPISGDAATTTEEENNDGD